MLRGCSKLATPQHLRFVAFSEQAQTMMELPSVELSWGLQRKATHSSLGLEMSSHQEPLTARFAHNVIASAAGHVEAADWAGVAAHAVGYASWVAVAPSLDARQPALREALQEAGAAVLVAGGDNPATAVADVPVGIAAGEMGIAETGSVLVVEHALGDRVTTMLCGRLLLVVDRDAVRERLESAAEWLSAHTSGAGFAALLTGPSRTADIERSLTIGVQGAQEVDVVVLG